MPLIVPKLSDIPVPEPSPKKQPKKLRINSRNIESFSKQKYYENIAELVGAVYPQLIAKIRDGNMKALEMGLQVANVLKPPAGGVSVVANVYNKNTAVSQAAGPERSTELRSFESILRRLEQDDAQRSIGGEVLEIQASK